jgi:hypothetical protein
MPDPTRLLTTLHRATTAFRATPGRRGRLVSLEDVAEVLVAGDLHGNLDNFRVLLQRANLTAHPRRHLVLQEVIHGPFQYPDGSDKSHQLVDLVAALKCQYPRQVHFLLGNHELSQATGRRIAKSEGELTELFRRGIDVAYGSHAEAVYAAYLELFAVVPCAVRTPNRVFLSHSLPSARHLDGFTLAVLEQDEHRPEELRSGGAVYALLWGRDTTPATVAAFLAKVDADLLISGHLPCEQGFEAPNDRQLILDTLGSPACYCLFPADRPLTHAELVACVATI